MVGIYISMRDKVHLSHWFTVVVNKGNTSTQPTLIKTVFLMFVSSIDISFLLRDYKVSYMKYVISPMTCSFTFGFLPSQMNTMMHSIQINQSTSAAPLHLKETELCSRLEETNFSTLSVISYGHYIYK